MTRTKRKATPRQADAFSGEQKYVLCPASDHLHTPLVALVYPSSKRGWPMATCSCGCRAFLSGRWDHELHGLTRSVVIERGLGTEQLASTPRPPLRPGKGTRYVICPGSYFIHAGLHATPVKLKKVFYAQCFGCGCNFFMKNWTHNLGYLREHVAQLGATCGE